jgi:hypothetical protein
MCSARWAALMESVKEFIDKQHASSEKNEIPVQDLVSIFFHESKCKIANCKKKDGTVVPFVSIPLIELSSDSLLNEPRVYLIKSFKVLII